MPIRRLAPPLIAVSAMLAAVSGLGARDVGDERYWAQWRGPQATGVSKNAKPPTEWSETKNIRWKKEIPGRGSGTPVVWGDRLYVLTAVPVAGAGAPAASGGPVPVHRYIVMALDRKTGNVVWQQTSREEAPHEGTHQQFGTFA